MSELPFTPIPSNQIGGAIVVYVFATLSTIALASVILRVLWLAVQRRTTAIDNHECVFFNTQLGQYAACLIIGMVFEAVAGIIGLRWVLEHGITAGWPCRIQATLMQIGNFSIGYFTTAIAVHTFNCLVVKMRQSVIICRTTIALGWIFSLLVAFGPFFVHSPEGFVYGASGLVCGVRSEFPKSQFIFHILPILLASILGAVLYSVIFLVLRGTLNFKQGIKITLNPNERWNGKQGVESYHRFIARIAKSMLWYPVAYVAFLVPYAVTRLFMISGFLVPFQAVVFASVCWFSLSFVDVLLLYNTFRVLGPAFEARSAASTRKTESFSATNNLEKYGIGPSPLERAMIENRIQHYRSQSELSISNSSTSGRSTRQLLPLYMNREDYPAASNPSPIGRSITPISDRNWEIATPLATAASPLRSAGRYLTGHLRSESLSSAGLPAPPLRKMSRPSDLDNTIPRSPLAYANDNLSADQWLSRQRSTQTFGQRDSPIKSPSMMSIMSEEGMYDSSSRSHRQQESPPSSYGHQPMLSAVVGSFNPVNVARSPPTSTVTIERSTSAYSSAQSSSQTRGHRPLLMTRGSSPDLRDSQRNAPRRS